MARWMCLAFALMTVAAVAQEDDIERELAQDTAQDQLPTPPPPSPTENQQHEDIQRPSAGSGEKIFDWRKYRGEREIPHPFAEKGLLRIRRDRTYIYRVPESEQKRAVAVRLGPYDPINLVNPDKAEGERGRTFQENYQQASFPAILMDYEWQFWRSPIGKWGLRLGSGVFVAQGNGHFVSTTETRTPLEIFTFLMAPINLGAIYRLQIWDRQLFVPYAEGGGTLYGFMEFRDDDRGPKFGGAFGAYFAGGLAMNLTYFDALSRINLDREYGINRVYLTAEYRGIIGLSRFDFSSDFVNGGLVMEF